MNSLHGIGYAVLLFVEASLGKTKYGSLAGLAIAGLKCIVSKFKPKSKEDSECQ